MTVKQTKAAFSSTRSLLTNDDPEIMQGGGRGGAAAAHPGVLDDEEGEAEEVAGVEDVEVAGT
jgi:hypothetical protein